MNEPNYSDNYEKQAKGWFTETGVLWPGQAMAIECEEKLFDQKSEYQHVQVFKTKTYGTMLVLDGAIQTTDRDECSYSEMMSNLPMCAHPNPKRVALIGGGDGGVLREICRHESVELVDHCELDKVVCEVSQKYIPYMAQGLNHPKVNTQFKDGAQWLKDHENYYDVVIVDASDPVGPACTLFQEEFYQSLKKSLREGGIICTQGECMWLHQDLIVSMLKFSKKLFKYAAYAYTTIPTYPSGTIGFIVCSDVNDPTKPKSFLSEEQTKQLKYYTPEIHEAAFKLPKFLVDQIRSL